MEGGDGAFRAKGRFTYVVAQVHFSAPKCYIQGRTLLHTTRYYRDNMLALCTYMGLTMTCDNHHHATMQRFIITLPTY